MGKRGVGSFENDQAMDFVGELEGTKDLSLLEAALDLEDEDEDEDLDASIGEDIVVAGEIVAALMGKPGRDLPAGASAWVAAHRGIDVSTLRPKAIHLLRAVLSEGSKLRQQWARNAKDGPRWQGSVTELLARLED